MRRRMRVCSMRQAFEIPGRLPGMNEYSQACRKSALQGGLLKRQTEEDIMWAAKAAKLKPMKPGVIVNITWIEPNMRRDKDNIRTGVKFILDALVSLKVLGNDNWAWVEDINDEYRVNGSNPRVVVELVQA